MRQAKLSRKGAAIRFEPGNAGIEAFFTSKGNDVFVILPRWPRSSFTVRDSSGVKAVTLLGSNEALKFKVKGSGIAVELPVLSDGMTLQPAWVLKVSR
jgi:alpha-L-fucosidase